MTKRPSTYVAYLFCFICAALFMSGCNDSLPPIIYQPEIRSVDDLVSEATRIVSEGLADDDRVIRANAIEVVAATKQIKLMPKVQRLIRDDFVPVRFAAALAIGDLEYTLAQRSVQQLMNDENQNVRIAAAYAMYKLGYAQSLDLVRKAIASSDQTVRANAALLLGKSGDKNALIFLWWTLGHKDSADKVRFQAAESIAALGDERIYDPKLWTMLISAYADDRLMGVRAMGALGTVQAKNALITMLSDDVLEVRLTAAERLGALKDTIGEPVVLDIFAKNLTAGLNKEDLERVNMRTALAIGEIGTARLMRFLPKLLKDQSKSVRLAAAKAVFQCIGKQRTDEKSPL